MLIIVHYGEIALKGDNRAIFEDKLVENIKKSLQKQGIVFKLVKRLFGRIIIETELQGTECLANCKALGALQNVFGIANFAVAQQCDKNIEKIKEKASDILSQKDFKTFKVEAKRSDKNFPLTSQQVNELVGEAVLKIKNQKLKISVNLENPDITLYIEITQNNVFLYTEKIQGPGGLPVGISGKAICLISGGIDSPVAAWQMMKRGVEVIFVHFFSEQEGYKQTLGKVRDLLRVLSNFQPQGVKVYFAPFSDIQKEILLKTQEDLRVVLYRRFMFRVAEEIVKKELAKALITGENVGQVASQTLDNMLATSEATSLLVLRPLAGWDKIEIINIAKKIHTFEISILPHLDCCTMFTPKHPATKANLANVKKQEKKLKIKKLISTALKTSTLENI